MTPVAQLDQLKDIHFPKDSLLYPIAIGWYILLGIIIITAIILIRWQIKANKKREQKKFIYGLLENIEQRSSPETIVCDTSILLKRVAMLKFAHLQPQMLFGEKWLEFLNNTGKTSNFTQGVGRHLQDIYKKQPIINQSAFFIVIRQWLKVVL